MGASNEEFANGHTPIHFTFHDNRDNPFVDSNLIVNAWPANEEPSWSPSNRVGMLIWHPDSGEIQDIRVRDNFRRQGIATSMLGEARRKAAELGTAPVVHGAQRTDDGDAWMKGIGESGPPKVKSFLNPDTHL